MARKISMRQALNEALDQEMARDPRVIVGHLLVQGLIEGLPHADLARHAPLSPQ